MGCHRTMARLGGFNSTIGLGNGLYTSLCLIGIDPRCIQSSGLSRNLFGAPAPLESQCARGNNDTPERSGTLPPCRLRLAAPFCSMQDETQHKLSKRSAGADQGLLQSANDNAREENSRHQGAGRRFRLKENVSPIPRRRYMCSHKSHFGYRFCGSSKSRRSAEYKLPSKELRETALRASRNTHRSF